MKIYLHSPQACALLSTQTTSISTFSFALCLLSTCATTVHVHDSRFIWFGLRLHLIRKHHPQPNLKLRITVCDLIMKVIQLTQKLEMHPDPQPAKQFKLPKRNSLRSSVIPSFQLCLALQRSPSTTFTLTLST